MKILDVDIQFSEGIRDEKDSYIWQWKLYGKDYEKTVVKSERGIESIQKQVEERIAMIILKETAHYLYNKDKDKKQGKYLVCSWELKNDLKDAIPTVFLSKVYHPQGGKIQFYTDVEDALKLKFNEGKIK